jgi:hypothetical protein
MFQGGWLACVLGAAHGSIWLGPAAGAALLAMHLALQPASRRGSEARLLLTAGLLGLGLDAGLQAAGVIRYEGWPGAAWAPPPWLPALWMLFASTLRHSLSWLRARLILASACGAALGPISYLAGARLGALAIGDHRAMSLIALATVWAFAMPVLLAAARR